MTAVSRLDGEPMRLFEKISVAALVCIALPVSASACETVFDLPPSAQIGDAGADDRDAMGADATGGGTPGCRRAGSGLFVQNGAENLGFCASDVSCPSIDQALGMGGAYIYVQEGTYSEKALQIPAGVTIEGGWQRVATMTPQDPRSPAPATYTVTWTKGCDANPHQTIVVSPGMIANNIGGSATLIDLVLQVSRSVPAGTSKHGIQALGSTTSLSLTDVRVEVSDAPNGATGTAGAVGAQGSDDCPTGDAGAVTSNGIPGDSADAGVFARDGYHATPGSSGATGTNGNAGMAGATGGCLDCISQCSGSGTCTVATVHQCGDQGKSGCGGLGGIGGAGGSGGGSSIALYVWDAHVNVTRGALVAGNGGAPGVGGPGGAPGAGGVGLTGQSRPTGACMTSCQDILGTCTATGPDAGPGGSGTVGGTGGRGGVGGPGSPGASFAIVRGGTAIVTYDDAGTLKHGVGGLDIDGGRGPSGNLGP